MQLRRPLKEVLESFDPDPLRAARTLRDFVENQDENLLDDRWRIRVINQHELWKVGCSGGVAGVPGASTSQEHEGSHAFQGEYIGGKWGIYLRAPHIFFKLLDRCGSRLVPLGQLAEIRRGVTSGADDFFFLRDVTEDEIAKSSAGLAVAAVYDGRLDSALAERCYSPALDRRFKDKWGIPVKDTERVRVIESGDGSPHLIEAEYLEPEVHSLMEIDSVEIDPAKLSRKILLVSDPPEKLKGTHVLKYIKWGENEGFDQRPSCASRMPSRQWYDLAPAKPGALLWPLAHQYRHIVPLNPKRIIANKRLFDVHPQEGISPKALCAVLNSTLVALLKYLYGRQVGREGNLDTEVVDARMMIVPDVRAASRSIQQRLEDAFDLMQKRSSQPLLRELKQDERIALDDAALEFLGIAEGGEREKIRNELYSQITCLYREIREVELKKQVERRATARRDRASPRTIAEEIWEEFDETQLRSFPLNFILDGEAVETVNLPAGKAKVLDDLFHRATLQVNGKLIKFDSKVRAEFAARIVALGHYGEAPIPKADRACERALESYRRYESQMESTFKDLAEERSADPEIQSRIVRELWKIYYASVRQT